MKTKIIFSLVLIFLILIQFSSAGDFPNPNFEDRKNVHIMQDGNNLMVYFPGAAAGSTWNPNVEGTGFCTDYGIYLTKCGSTQDNYWLVYSSNQEIPINNSFFNRIYNPLIRVLNHISIDPIGEEDELIINEQNEIISGRIDVESAQIDIGPIIYSRGIVPPIINLKGTIRFDSGEIILINGEEYSRNNFNIECLRDGRQYTSDKITLQNIDSKGAIRIPFSSNSIAACNSRYLEEFYPGIRVQRVFQGLAPQGTFLNWLKANPVAQSIFGIYSSRSEDLCINSNSELKVSFDKCSNDDVKAYTFTPTYSYMNIYASSNKKLGGNLCSFSGNFIVNGQDSVSRQCINLIDGSIPSFMVGLNQEIETDKLAYEKQGRINYNLPVLYEEDKVIEEINNKYSNFEIAYIIGANNINLIKTT